MYSRDSKKNALGKQIRVAVIDNKAFKNYLRHNIRDNRQIVYRLRIAREHVCVLQTADASDLLKLSTNNRLYVMKKLAKLSKFLGCYSEWQAIRQNYWSSWKQEDDVTIFKRITKGVDIDSMLQWVRKASRIAPANRDVLRYACLTGLRPEESVNTRLL